MKGKKGLLLFLVLLLVLGVFAWQFFLKKKLKKPKAAKPKAPVEAPQPSPPPSSPPPTGALPAAPTESAPTESAPSPQAPPPMPGALPETSPALPQGAPSLPGQPVSPPKEAGVPTAQPQGAESQPLIGLNAGPDLRLAEGTTLLLEQAKVDYQGKRKLQFQWERLSGPEDKLEVLTPTELQARVTVGNLEQPEEFVLRLHATDGLTEATDDIVVQGFPAQLKAVSQVGGAWIGVNHMGDKWVAARGRQLEVFGADWSPLTQIPFDFPLQQFFSVVDSAGHGALYAQDPQGNWVVAQNDPAQGSRITHLPMLGRQIHRLIPIQLEGQPYGFALLDKEIELWDFSEPRAPKLRKTLTTQLQTPAYLTFHGRHLYVADEQNIEILDFSTGQPLASVPSGGSITALSSYDQDGKGFLLAAIGPDRTLQKRQDYGLRIFELDSGGRLGPEKRIPVGESGTAGRPIVGAVVIPGVNRAFLSVQGANGLELRLFDLVGQKTLPLKFSTPTSFVALDEIATGKVGDQPVAVVADGNQLRVFSFQGDGVGYTAALLKNFPGLLSAAWVASDAKGSQLWIGDEGTKSGGSLSLAQGTDLKISKSFNGGGSYPVDGTVDSSGSGVLLYLSSNPTALAPETPEGDLGMSALSSEQEPARSKPFLGVKGAQGELRPLGVAAHRDDTGTLMAVAISRVTGALGGSGIALLQQGKDKGAAAFLAQDLKTVQQIVPLQDGRDVALSPDGKTAFVAGGAEGVIAVDLVKKQPVSRMSLGKSWLADRVLLSHGGQIVLACFIDPTRGQAILKIFGVTQPTPGGQGGLQMQEYGTIQGMKVTTALEGPRAPRLALTEDDLYLFLPLGNNLSVFNLSNPADPFKIAELTLPDTVRGVAIANRFKDIFVALGGSGVAKLEFGFIIPQMAKVPETHPEGAPLGAETKPTESAPIPETQPAR